MSGADLTKKTANKLRSALLVRIWKAQGNLEEISQEILKVMRVYCYMNEKQNELLGTDIVDYAVKEIDCAKKIMFNKDKHSKMMTFIGLCVLATLYLS